jgi:diaminohydroxyphosphoribosylaminopyrimidine deaminase/5-amino-6-(5-phosphoribosylamino)uracil reductase
LRVLLDAHGRVPASGALFESAFGPTLVLTTAAAPADAIDAWRAVGAKVEVLPAGPDDVGVDLTAALTVLGAHGVLQAMFEGGARVHGSIAAAGVADRIVAYVAPMLLGERGLPAFSWDGPETLPASDRFELASMTRLGDDVRIDLRRGGGTP